MKNLFFALAFSFTLAGISSSAHAQGYYCWINNTDEHNGCFARQECCTGNDGTPNCATLDQICSKPLPPHPHPHATPSALEE